MNALFRLTTICYSFLLSWLSWQPSVLLRRCRRSQQWSWETLWTLATGMVKSVSPSCSVVCSRVTLHKQYCCQGQGTTVSTQTNVLKSIRSTNMWEVMVVINHEGAWSPSWWLKVMMNSVSTLHADFSAVSQPLRRQTVTSRLCFWQKSGYSNENCIHHPICYIGKAPNHLWR